MASIGNINVKDCIELRKNDKITKFGTLCIYDVFKEKSSVVVNNVELGGYQMTDKDIVLNLKSIYSQDKLIGQMKQLLQDIDLPAGDNPAYSFVSSLHTLNQVENEFVGMTEKEGSEPTIGVIIGEQNTGNYILANSDTVDSISIYKNLEELKNYYYQNEKYYGSEAMVVVFTHLNDFNLGKSVSPKDIWINNDL